MSWWGVCLCICAWAQWWRRGEPECAHMLLQLLLLADLQTPKLEAACQHHPSALHCLNPTLRTSLFHPLGAGTHWHPRPFLSTHPNPPHLPWGVQ